MGVLLIVKYSDSILYQPNLLDVFLQLP